MIKSREKNMDAGSKIMPIRYLGTIYYGDDACLPPRTAYNVANVVRNGGGARRELLKILSRGSMLTGKISFNTFLLPSPTENIGTDGILSLQSFRILSVLTIGKIPKAGR